MRLAVLFIFGFGLLFGCKEDDLLPQNNSLDVSLLKQYSWENRTEVEEQAVDQSEVYQYVRNTSLSFTESQFTHKTASYFLNQPKQSGSVNLLPALDNGEFYGAYKLSAVDSVLTFSFNYSNALKDRWNLPKDSVVSNIQYKIIQLNKSTLEMRPISDIQINGASQILTFKSNPK